MVENFISVIIPVYNDSIRLRKCLRALGKQSISKDQYEIIVVDNNSSENIQQVISDFKFIDIHYAFEGQAGSYIARNTGIKIAKGNILAFTDSDCIPDKDWLKNGRQCLVENSNVGIVAGKISLFYKSPKLNAVEVYEKYTAFKQKDNAASGSCVGANWFSYKSVIKEFGCFDSSLKSNGDTVLSSKISRGGYKVIYADKVVIAHPSRFTFKEIGNKYKRLFGGKYDRHEGNKLIFSLRYLFTFIFRRLRFNLKKFFLLKPAESFKLFVVNIYLFYAMIAEAISLASGRKTKRL